MLTVGSFFGAQEGGRRGYESHLVDDRPVEGGGFVERRGSSFIRFHNLLVERAPSRCWGGGCCGAGRGFLLRPISFRTSLSSRAAVEVSVFLKPRRPPKFGSICELVSFSAGEKGSVFWIRWVEV